jgi:hypothetical protein
MWSGASKYAGFFVWRDKPLGGCGLPSTDMLADGFVAGNGKIQGAGKPSTRQLSGNRHVRTNRATERQWRAGPDGQTALLDELPRNGSESHRALAQCGGVPSDLARLGNGQNPANPAEEACLTRFRYTTKDANR